jgi:hypothetical protein
MSAEETREDRIDDRRFLTSKIRPGELLTAISIIGSAIWIWTGLNAKIAIMEQAQTSQVQTNRELREEIRGVAVEIKSDIREMRQELRARRAM